MSEPFLFAVAEMIYNRFRLYLDNNQPIKTIIFTTETPRTPR